MFEADYDGGLAKRLKSPNKVVRYYFDYQGWLTVYGDIPPAMYNHNYTIVPIKQPIDRSKYWYRFYRGQWEQHKIPTTDEECEGIILTMYTGEYAYNSAHNQEVMLLLKHLTKNSTKVKLEKIRVPEEDKIVYHCVPIDE